MKACRVALVFLLTGLAAAQVDDKNPKSRASSAPTAPQAGSDVKPLSPKQAEVWRGEENLHTYERQKDAKGFLSLWDENFIGWPNYEPRPVPKWSEAVTVDSFKAAGASTPTLPPPQPLAVGLFGDVAVTQYFWPEADQSSPTVYRTTHTWQNGPAGWRIIGGMSCEVPRPGVAKTAEEARRDDVKAVADLDTQYQAAVKINDAATMDRILADDFILVEGDGATNTKADLLSEARSRRITYEHQEETGRSQTVRVWGNTAVVTAKLWGQGTDGGKPFDWTLWFSDTYVRVDGKWRYAFGQASLPLPKK